MTDNKNESIVIETDLKGLDEVQKDIDKEINRLWDLSAVLSSIKRVVDYFKKSGELSWLPSLYAYPKI